MPLDYKLPEQKHEWRETPDKPWTCKLCEFSTANLRHIENGYCYHDWSAFGTNKLECCLRCGIVMNSRNVAARCIGKVSVGLRNSDIEDCSNPTGKLLAACERLLAVAKEIGQMPKEQRDWFFEKEGHADAFLVAAALRERLVREAEAQI